MNGKWSLMVGVLALLWVVPGMAEPLVDCSKKELQSKNSARSLYLWTDGVEKEIRKAKEQGVLESTNHCPRAIRLRGSAHCKEPTNAEYRAGLARVIELCRPNPVAKGGPVDCSDKRFTHPEASVELLLRWTDLALSGLDSLQSHESSRIKPICDRALKNAGTAYCKAPKNPKTVAAVAKVRKRCAAARAAEEAKKSAAAKAETDRKAAAKANRKIVKFPRSTYKGGGAARVAAQMKRALLASRLAKSPREVLRVQPMGRWVSGRYTDTKVRYQKITGLVLWWDDDSDGVCRFTSYNFIKDRGPLKAKSFCMGCPEGWTRCK